MSGRAALPRPDLIGGLGQQFGLLTDRMTTLAAAFDDLALGCKNAIHAADPTQTDAFIEQGGKDLGQSLGARVWGPESGWRSGGDADGQAPDPARFPVRHALKVVAVFPRVAGPSVPRDADAGSPETPSAPRRPHWSGRIGQAALCGPHWSGRTGQAAMCGQSHNRRHHDLPLLPETCSISSSSAATFFGWR